MLVSLRKSLVVVLFAFLFVAWLAGSAFAIAAGDLDTSFSGDGKVTTNFTDGNDLALGIAIQSDGKIVAAGRAGGSGGRFAVTRYNTDGTLDSSFSGDGKVTTNFTTGDDFAEDVAIDSNDNIIAAGRAGGFGGRFAVARYDIDGNLDSSFSGDGKLTTNFTTGNDVAFGVAIDSDGNIVVAGGAGGADPRFALARYMGTDGTLDASFSGDGKQTTNFTNAADFAEDVAIDSGGNIVAVGRAGGFGGRFAAARYDPTDGSLDTSFSGDGKATTNFTDGDDFANSVAIDSSDNVVAAGRAGGFGGRFALVRYLGTDGTLDTSFSGDGKQTTNFTGGDDFALGVTIDCFGFGQIVAAGAVDGANYRFGLARYNSSDGTLDTDFSGDGKVTTDFTSGDDFATDVATSPVDADVFAVGRAGGFGGRFAAAEYLSLDCF